MSGGTSIEWTDRSHNPIRARSKSDGKIGWHCEKVSAGCKHCYAEKHNGRRLPGGGTGLEYTLSAREGVDVFLDEALLVAPLKWRRAQRVFLSSMTDIFADFVTDEMLDRLFAVMALTPHITWQVLTKRPARAREYSKDLDALRGRIGASAGAMLDGHWIWNDGQRFRQRIESLISACSGIDDEANEVDELALPLANVWLGVSCEDQKTADERVHSLRDTPAAVRFVSAEPLLGDIDLVYASHQDCTHASGHPDPDTNEWNCSRCEDNVDIGVDWVIVGGESGPRARPCNVAWIRSIVSQCNNADVACFVKQIGSVPLVRAGDAHGWRMGQLDARDPTFGDDVCIARLGSRKGGDLDEWPSDLRVRRFPRSSAT